MAKTCQRIIWTDTLDQRLIEYAKKYNHECSKIRDAMGFTPDQDEQIKDRYNKFLRHKPPRDKTLDFVPERDPNYLSMLVSQAKHESVQWQEKAQIAPELFMRSLDELENNISSDHFKNFCHQQLCDVTTDKDISNMANKNIG